MTPIVVVMLNGERLGQSGDGGTFCPFIIIKIKWFE